jgi:hypothetical protein
MNSQEVKPSVFSSDPFDAWLNNRRQQLNLPVGKGRGKRLNSFEAWLVDAWPLLSELPELIGFTLAQTEARVFLSHSYSGAFQASRQTLPIQCFQMLRYKTPQNVEAFLRLLQTERRRGKVKAAAFESRLAKANDLLASLTQEYPGTDPSVFLRYFANLGGNIPVSRLARNYPRSWCKLRRLPASRPSRMRSIFYLAPLRLMAAEALDRLRESGIRCSLVTGEEQLLDEEACHAASTIEMLDPDDPYEVAVIDEVQMIRDASAVKPWRSESNENPLKHPFFSRFIRDRRVAREAASN